MKKTDDYQQASAIPFRRTAGGIEYCLITSSGQGDWVFPKGIIDPGETPAQTAIKESREEAGIKGLLLGEPLGVYEYRKWDSRLRVLVYLMEVTAIEEEWDEAEYRERAWLEFKEARRRIDRDYLKKLLRLARQRLDES